MNLIVDKIVTGPFQENCFIVWNENQNEAILIDPGDEHQLIIDQIEEKNLTPIAILNTHAHLDHIGAVSKLKETYNIPFYIHKEERVILDSYESSCEMFGLPIKEKPKVDKWLDSEKKLRLGGFSIIIINTPGHTPGGICYEIENHIFVGDTLFLGSVGRTDLPGGNWDTLQKSLIHLISIVDHDKTIHSGHGNDTKLNHELISNPFLLSLKYKA